MIRPYKEEKVEGSVFIRTFPANTPEEELKWHWDEEDRIIQPIGETDWQFQFDNELPIKIYREIRIPAGVIHRVIKGSGDLVLKVEKLTQS
jgi:hypothetical protein